MSLMRSFITISGFTLLSRIAGFVRDILFASVLGAGPLAEVFLVAFKLPNFFRRLFAEGAFNASFVPIFTQILAEGGERRAINFANQIFAVLLSTLIVFCVILEIFMPWVMMGLAPGFVGAEEQFDLAVLLTRITFPYLIFISLVSLLAGMQSAIQRFAAGAAAPIILNACLIVALLMHAEFAPSAAHASAIAVGVAGVLQFLWMLFACMRSGQYIKLVRPRLTPEMKHFVRRMIPGVIGAGVMQINLWIDIVIATFIPGAIAFLYFADRVNQLPLSLIGIALGTALLPMLSRLYKAGKNDEAVVVQNRALEIALLLTLPAVAAFMVIGEQMVRVLFERGEFLASDTLATTYALMAYAVGLPAFVMVKIFAPSFFAQGDTTTPVRVAVCCLIANVVMNIMFVLWFKYIGIMPHIGLALATAFSSWLNVYILLRILSSKGDFTLDQQVKKRIVRMIISVVLMAGVLVVVKGSVEPTIGGLILLILSGKVSYVVAILLTGAYSVADLKKLRRARE